MIDDQNALAENNAREYSAEARRAALGEDTEKEEAAAKEAQAKAEARAAYAAHPHTQLTKLLADLRTPALDINARVSQVHNAVSRLAQLVLQHTPPPDDAMKEAAK